MKVINIDKETNETSSEKLRKNGFFENIPDVPEKAILISVDNEVSLNELEELAKTAGVVVLEKILKKNTKQNSTLFIGKGTAESIHERCMELSANCVVFDEELSGAQIRNLERVLDVKIIDRTTLILDIFAKRAISKEGKIQVELAQLNYMLPRLMGKGVQLSRLGGGIGTRGPGEKKLETDRRHIKRRILFLESDLMRISKRRNFRREGRRKKNIPTAALVGYTNAGKSTVMNRLCKSDVFVEDKLFATLDPTSRKYILPDGREIMIIDTVGFIRKLPHYLIEAFKSSLEEAVYADLLLHVVDISSNDSDEQIDVVNKLLSSMGVMEKPILTIYNKTDLVNTVERLSVEYSGRKPIEISAKTGEGMEKLVEEIQKILPQDEEKIFLFIPYSKSKIISYIHENSKITKKDFTEEGIEMSVIIEKIKKDKIKEFIVKK